MMENKQKPRLLEINSVCGIKSTGKIAVQIAEEYEAEGYECRIAYGREDVPAKYKKYAYRIGTKAGNYISALKVRIFDNEGLNNYFATKKFLKWATEYDPDVLWLHNIHGYYLHYPLLFQWIKSRPEMKVFWTLHDCWTFTGHCYHFVIVNCNKWTTGCSHCEQKKIYPSSLLLDNSKNNYRKKKECFTNVKDLTIVTPSKWLAGLVKESFLGAYPSTVRYTRIDKTIFKPTPSDFRKKYDIDDKFMVLGVASTWTKRKGLNDFIRLSSLLDDRYVIVLVGLTEKQIRELPPKKFIGIARTNNAEELAKIYSAADVFFDPTYEDTYPTVNLEAEACGTRVVTYDTGGSRETLSRDDSVVIDTGDILSFIKQIRL